MASEDLFLKRLYPEYNFKDESESMFYLAESFYLCSFGSRVYFKRAPKSILKSLSEYMNKANIVNEAFAAELYLKCLLVLTEDKNFRTHNLIELFNHLNEVIRDRIISAYESGSYHLSYVYRLQSKPKENSFIEILEKLQLAFVEQRYNFTEPFNHDGELEELFTALRSTIIEINPTLITHGFLFY